MSIKKIGLALGGGGAGIKIEFERNTQKTGYKKLKETFAEKFIDFILNKPN